ncbi:MAG: hypothetical protein AAGA58_14305 [Verrucomicrobiota bacterium]
MPVTPEQAEILHLLMPLHFFYEKEGKMLPGIRFIDPAEMPDPQNGLLVHERDMTSTLSRFHESKISLEVKARELSENHLLREVILRRADDGAPVEYGAIGIRLEKFDGPIRDMIADGAAPLGELIEAHVVNYRSCPRGFFRVIADETIAKALDVAEGSELYGRSNELTDRDGIAFADIVEVLP